MNEEATRKDLEEQLSLLRRINRELERSKKTNKQNEDSQNKALKALRAFKDSLKESGEELRRVAGIFVTFNTFRSLADTANELIKMNSELHRSVINAGKGAENVKQFSNMAADLRIQFGATAEQAERVTKALAAGQYAGTISDINKAAEASYQFARGMNLDYNEVTKNSIELQKWGKISASTTMSMYTDIMKVAQGHGLTEEAAKGVMEQTTKLSGYMRAFGKSEADIKKMNSGLAKMTSAMEKVGISAQEALTFVDKLLDPEKIQENIGAYAALGISISDAISGNINPDTITAGMKEVGQRIKEMGPIAGKAYADAMGISYKDAIKAADLQQITEEFITPEETAAEEMKELVQATKNSSEQIKDTMNRIEGALQKLGPSVLISLAVITPFLLNVFKKREYGESLGKSLASGIANGGKKGFSIVKKLFDKDGLKSDRKKMKSQNLKETKDYSLLETKSGRKKFESNTNILKEENKLLDEQIQKIKASASNLTDRIHIEKQKVYQTEKELADLELLKNNSQNLSKEEKRAISEKQKQLKDILSFQKQQADVFEKTAQAEIDDLNKIIKKQQDLNEVINGREKALEDANKTAPVGIISWGNELKKIRENRESYLDDVVENAQQEINNLNKFLKTDITKAINEAQINTQINEASLEKAKSKLEDAQNELNAAQEAQKNAEEALEKLLTENKTLADADVAAANKQAETARERVTTAQKELNAAKESKNSADENLKASQNQLEAAKEQKKNAQDQMDAARQRIKKANKEKGQKSSVTLFNHFKALPHAIKNSIKDIASGVGGAIGKGIGKFGGMIGKAGKALGKMTLVLGPIMMLVGFLRRMVENNKDVQQKMEQLQKVVSSIFEKVLEPLLSKDFDVIFENIQEALINLAPVIRFLIAVAVKIVSAVTSAIKTITGIFSKFSKDRETYNEARNNALKNNTEAIEKSTEVQPERLRMASGGGVRLVSSASQQNSSTTSIADQQNSTTVPYATATSINQTTEETTKGFNKVARSIDEFKKNSKESISQFQEKFEKTAETIRANIELGVGNALSKTLKNGISIIDSQNKKQFSIIQQ